MGAQWIRSWPIFGAAMLVLGGMGAASWSQQTHDGARARLERFVATWQEAQAKRDHWREAAWGETTEGRACWRYAAASALVPRRPIRIGVQSRGAGRLWALTEETAGSPGSVITAERYPDLRR